MNIVEFSFLLASKAEIGFDYMALINALMALGNLMVIIWVADGAWSQFKTQRAFSYSERFNSDQLIEARIVTTIYLKELKRIPNEDRPAAIRELLKSDKGEDIRKCVMIDTMANFFTEIGSAYRNKIVPREALILLGTLIKRSWEALEPYVQEKRRFLKQGDLHVSFERIYEEVKFKGLDADPLNHKFS